MDQQRMDELRAFLHERIPFLGKHLDIDPIVSDVLTVLQRKDFASTLDMESLKRLAMRFARWRAIDQIRKNRRRQAVLNAYAAFRASPEQSQPDDALLAQEREALRQKLRDALAQAVADRLSERERQVVYLTSQKGLSGRKAAELLGLAESSLRRTEKRALIKLRLAMQEFRDIYQDAFR